jgi:hypothetical protein
MKALCIATLLLAFATQDLFAQGGPLGRLAPPPGAAIHKVALSSALLCVLTKDANVWTTPAYSPGQWTLVYEGVANRTDIVNIAVGWTEVYVQTMHGVVWRRAGTSWRRVTFGPSALEGGYGDMVCIGDDLVVAGPSGSVYRYEPSTDQATSLSSPPMIPFWPRLEVDASGRLYAWQGRGPTVVARYDFASSRWDPVGHWSSTEAIADLVPDGAFAYAWAGGEGRPKVHVLQLTHWSEVPGTEDMMHPAAAGGRLFAVAWEDDQGTYHPRTTFVKISNGAAWTTVARIDGHVKATTAHGDRIAVLTQKDELFTASIRALARAGTFDRLRATE